MSTVFQVVAIVQFVVKVLKTKEKSDLLVNNAAYTARKVSKYGFFSGPHFHVFGMNT